MRAHFAHHSFKVRIVLTTLAVFVAGLWSLSFYTSRLLREDMQRLLTEQQVSTVTLVAGQVDQELANRLQALQTLAGMAAEAVRRGPAATLAMLEQRPIMLSLFNGGIVVYGADGTVLADFPSLPGRQGQNFLDVDVVATALAEGKASIGRPQLGKATKSPMVNIGAPIRDAEGRIVGVVAGVINLGRPNFLDAITTSRYGKTGYYLIEEPRGRLIITGTDRRRVMQPLPPAGVNALIDRHVQGFDDTGITINPVGVEVLATARRIPVAGWFIVAALPTEEAFAPIRAMERRMLLATLLLTLLAGGLSWWLLRRQLAPLLDTVASLAGMASGARPLQVLAVARRDEIGQLVSGFNRLLTMLMEREEAVRHSQEQLMEAQRIASLGSYVLDIAGGRWTASAVADSVFGIDATFDHTLDGWLMLVHPDDRAAMALYFSHEVVERGNNFDRVYRIVRHDDHRVRWVQGLGRLEYAADGAGRPLRLRGTVQDITARQEIDEALKASERRFRDLVDTTDGIVWEADASTFSFTYVSAKAERLLGFSIADWRQPGFWIEHLHPEDAKWAPAYCASCTGRQEPHDFEYRFIARDGRVVWLRDIVTVVAEGGQPRWLRGLMVDITERKATEAILRASEARYRAVAESANDAIVTADCAGQIMSWNPAAAAIFGYPEAVALGMPLGNLMAPRYRLRHLAGFDRWVAGEPLARHGRAMDVVGMRQDGSEVPLELSLSDWETAEGKFMTATIRDITERKQAEADLRIAATAFESQEAMIIADANTVILKVNRAFTRITGYSEAEAVGRTTTLLKSGRQDAEFYRNMWQSLARDGFWQGEIWNRRKNGEVFPERLAISAVSDGKGQVSHYVAAFSDITQHKQAQDEILHLAFTDPLTELPNRRLLMDRLKQALAAAARHRRPGALMLIDLDDFKTLNDTAGHDKGDLLLRKVAQRLTRSVRDGDTVARVGGDEFVVMLESLGDDEADAAAHAEAVGEKILASLNQPYLLAGYESRSTPSIGITLFGAGNGSVEDLLKQADLAMYRAKAAGRNALCFFDPQMQAAVSARAALEADLRHAVQEGRLQLHYQPQVDADGRLTGAEALVRWHHPARGMVSPGEFIPLAEDSGLILPLGQWVLRTACVQLVAWAALPATRDLTLAVNVSARQFHHRDFVEQVIAIVAETGADPRRLKLELTESLLVEDVEDTIAKMARLRSEGISFSLDDFGTGYSSLAYLKRLPLDQLKIDQSFVRDVLTDPNDAAIAKTVVALGQSLGLAVIAEGVETAAQRDFLASQGCRAYQGYYFGRPMPVAEFDGRAGQGAPAAEKQKPSAKGEKAEG